ncbi:hypothetical protein F66182_2572 [Fusarium sp. NRRL 66182]|nr:hypothetical protein F66182_2572 [Fusarium sp. NRRL 66182]
MCVPQAAPGQWRKAPITIGGSACNCTSDVRSANSKPPQADNFQLNHHLWTSSLRPLPTQSQDAFYRCSPNVQADASHAATGSRHTISQRLRKLKQIPPELYPLAVVVGFAIGAAGYSISRKFIVDKNLRLSRQGAAARHDASHDASHGEGGHGEGEGH